MPLLNSRLSANLKNFRSPNFGKLGLFPAGPGVVLSPTRGGKMKTADGPNLEAVTSKTGNPFSGRGIEDGISKS